MTGQEIVNLTLTPNVEIVINYEDNKQASDVVNYGPGAVFISWAKTVAVNDPNCLMLEEDQAYEIRTRYHWQDLHLISAGEPIVQVVTR